MVRLSEILTSESANSFNEGWLPVRLSSMKMFIGFLKTNRIFYIQIIVARIFPGEGDIKARRLLDIDWCSEAQTS